MKLRSSYSKVDARALGVGVTTAVVATGLLIGVIGLGVGFFDPVVLIVLIGPPFLGGASVGYLLVDSSRSIWSNAWLTGFVSGFLLAFGLSIVFVSGMHFPSAPEYTAADLGVLLVAWPALMGLLLGLFWGSVTMIGGLAIGWVIGGRRSYEDR